MYIYLNTNKKGTVILEGPNYSVVPPSLLLKTAVTGLPVEFYFPKLGFLFPASPADVQGQTLLLPKSTRYRKF